MQLKKIKKGTSKEISDGSQKMDFLNKASKATKKLLTSISKSFDPQQLEREFQSEFSQIDEHKLMSYQSKLPQLIELLSFKALESIKYNRNPINFVY